jgi:SAM-dependent methyltransferase
VPLAVEKTRNGGFTPPARLIGFPGMRATTRLIFGPAAGVYDLVTAQEPWRRHCRAMGEGIPGRRVLDVGIGPGVSGIEMVRAAPGRMLVGLDASPAMLDRARRHGREAGVPLALVRADAGWLPFADASYDGAAGHSVLYLLDDSDAALRELHRVVRPGGRVAFLEPNALDGLGRLRAVCRAYGAGFRFGTSMLLWSICSALYGRYTPDRIVAQLVRCGFVRPRISPAFDGLALVASAVRP